MQRPIRIAVLAVAVLALGACATYQEHAPSWMPGSGAVSVKLSPAEEVPPVKASGSGSGTLRRLAFAIAPGELIARTPAPVPVPAPPRLP